MTETICKTGVILSIEIGQDYDCAHFDDGSVESVPASLGIGFFEGAMIALIKDETGQVIDINLERELSDRLGLVA